MAAKKTKTKKDDDPKVAKASTKKASTKKGKTRPEALQALALTVKVIGKFTKNSQKPIEKSNSPLPAVSSGSLQLDNMIGGTLAPDGSGPICLGYPRGHITEIYGPEASGKTTLALEAIASVQREGGTTLFLDFEHALHHGYAQSLGVKFDDSFKLYQPENMEQGLEMLRAAVMAGVDLVVVDSVAAMVPKKDMEKGFEDGDQIGSRARVMASLLPKLVRTLKEPSKHGSERAAVIFINQTRASISSQGGDETTSGGKALKFFAYLRLRAVRIRSEYFDTKDPVTKKSSRAPYGNHTRVKIIKSKVDAKEGRTCDIFIRFGQGIDRYYSAIEASVAHKVVKKSGAFYEFEGNRYQGREKFRRFLMSNDTLYDLLEEKVLEAIRTQDQIKNEDQLLEQSDEDADDILAKISTDSGDEEEDTEITEEMLDEVEGEDDVDLSEV